MLHIQYREQSKHKCVFCEPSDELILLSSDNFNLMLDPFALTPGHLLITSKGHYGCLGEVPEEFFAECQALRRKGYELISANFDSQITRYEHGRAGHCIAKGIESRSCHHYHEHLIPGKLDLHKLLENDFKSISFNNESEIIDLFYRYQEYLLVVEANGTKRFYMAKSENVPPHLLRTLAAQCLGVPELHDWEAYTSCDHMLAGKDLIQSLCKAVSQ